MLKYLVLICLGFTASFAHAVVPIYADGDIVDDGLINVSDYLRGSRMVLGEINPSALELSHGDLYPPAAPDGVFNLQDLLLLQLLLVQRANQSVETLDLFADGPATLSVDVDGNTASTPVAVGGYTGFGATVINNPNFIDPEDSSNTIWYVAVSGGIANAYLGTADLSANSILDTGYNLSGSGSGQLIFDIKVNSISPGAALTVKIDSGYPNLGQLALSSSQYTVGSWRRVALNFADLLANPGPGAGLDLNNVINAFVIEVTGGNADFYLDNIFISHACAEIDSCNATIKTKSMADADGDGIADANDLCPFTPQGTVVDVNGCPAPIIDTDNDGVADSNDLCPATPAATLVDSVGCAITPVADQDSDGIVDAIDQCPNTPAGSAVSALGCAITSSDIVPLYTASTALQADTQFDRGDALVTRFSDRPRTRHAREDQFQSYDHYVAFYFENRSSNIEIVDYVAKGGIGIEMNVRTIFPLSTTEAENRWFYEGFTTVAQYASNGLMTYLGFDGTYYHYQKTETQNKRLDRAIRVGDQMEFEISQFSGDGLPRGQSNYYGTAFLYIVGEGIVPWYAAAPGARFPEDSRKIPEAYWLGGNTTIHYQYSDEPNDHFIQMATNLGYDNGQDFLLGRRVHHSSTIDGSHDERVENGPLASSVGLTGTKYINDRCTACHDRNGAAPVAPNGELLDRWVFKVGDAGGYPDPLIGRVLQPRGSKGEGNVVIASWTELANGLRRPNYQFSETAPATFSARIAPRLVGLGLLEAIPEASILALEDPDDANEDGISGVASLVSDPENPQITRLGRFGWKAATASVRHQAAAALNTDLGVRTSVLPNPDCGASQLDCGSGSPIMPDDNLDKLVLYLSALGVRPQRGWETGIENQTIVDGKALFNDIGCSACHTQTLQTSAFHPLAEVRNQTIHPYSDLLLHDMGPGLADNLGEGVASGSEWRTTPLWGLGLSACVTGGVVNPSGVEGGEICTPHHAYLHDGRARTIDEAIRWHGGEAESSKQLYSGLGQSDKNTIIEFLKSL